MCEFLNEIDGFVVIGRVYFDLKKDKTWVGWSNFTKNLLKSHELRYFNRCNNPVLQEQINLVIYQNKEKEVEFPS